MAAPSEQPSTHVRLTILVVIVACLFVALFARLWFLQVINAPKAQAAAKNNGVELIYTPAPGGGSTTARAEPWLGRSTSR